ncbi:MAG: hypothetical protein WBL55_03455 [Xanthobacteraceae bacterium]
MADVAPVFAEALKLHQAGRLAEDELVYQRILASEPGHFDSLHLLGVIFMQRGDPAAAIRQIGAALKVAPHHILALNNRGNAFQHCSASATRWRAMTGRSAYGPIMSRR